MKKTTRWISLLLAIITPISLLSGCCCVPTEGLASHSKEEELRGLYLIVRDDMSDEDLKLLYVYPTTIRFNGDGTGEYNVPDSVERVQFNYTIDENNYVETVNTEITTANTRRPLLPYENIPNVSGHIEGNVYVLEHANLRYEYDG